MDFYIHSTSFLRTKKSFLLILILVFALPLKAQLGFGNNQWNVNCYNSTQSAPTVNPAVTTYSGSYSQKLDINQQYGFNSTYSWVRDGLPSDAVSFYDARGEGSKYSGSPTNVSDRKFSFVHKRQGFPLGKYRIFLKIWDDNTYIYINGVHKPFTGEGGYGDNRLIVNCFELDANSTIEVRTSNSGGGPSETILQIERTDILFVQNPSLTEVCKNTSVSLNGQITVGATSFSQDLYTLDFEPSSAPATYSAVPNLSNWTVGLGTAAMNSGSTFISSVAPSNSTKSFSFNFSTSGLTDVKLSFRQYYLHLNSTNIKVQVSLTGTSGTWSDIGNWNSNSGSPLVFFPVEINLSAAYNNKPAVFLKFLYTNSSTVTSGSQWAIDDILVTGTGPANIVYAWTPPAGLSATNIPNPTVTINATQTYNLSVTAGNCTVNNNVTVNMIEIPLPPTGASVQSVPVTGPNTYSVTPVMGVTYTWSTVPATGVGIFTGSNVGNSVLFTPTGPGDLIVTPSNACGQGPYLLFNNPLPVTLTSFSASCNSGMPNEANEIFWSTGSEHNSDYFLIEKSRDLETWTIVATEPAAGNSNTNINYSLLDHNSWNGITYYRLKQFDFNGENHTYDPLSISCENGNNSMYAYPNPSNGKFTVEIVSDKNSPSSQLNVIDVTGKTIIAEILSLKEGVNQVYIDSIDISAGVYILRLEGGDSFIEPIRVVVE